MSLLTRRRRRRPEINLVPLIDVLVLLVFFAFVTMQFRSSAALNLTLPRVETAGRNEFRGALVIGIDREGTLTFNGTPAPEAQLEGLLAEVGRIDRNAPVLIRADEETPLKTLAFVMDACRKAGLNKFSLQSR